MPILPPGNKDSQKENKDYQKFLRDRFGNRQYTDLELMDAADEFFGPLPIPPGSEIVSRGGGITTYRDTQGYVHSVRRDLSGKSTTAGEITDLGTDRPAVLPASQGQQGLTQGLLERLTGLSEQQQANALALARGETPAALDPGIKQYLDQINALSGQLQQRPELAALDPETQAALEAINQSEQGQLKQQFEQAQAQQLANLFGNRVNQSSIATNALGQLLQQQGLVSAEQLANSAARGLQTRQYLTGQQQQQRQLALQGLLGAAGTQLEGFRARTGASQAQMDALNDLLKQFTSQQTQRDIAGGGIEQAGRELAIQRELGLKRLETDRYLGKLQADAQRAAANRGLVGSGIGAAGAVIGGLL